MNKKLTVSILSIVAVIVVTIIAVAATKAPTPTQTQQKVQEQRNTVPVSAQAPQRMQGDFPTQDIYDCDFSDLMLDENGELVSEEIFEKNIENEVAKGNLSIEDKEFLLEMYDLMSDGGGCGEMGGGGCPFGM